MDSYLSGRENLGDTPKPKEEPNLLPPQALEKLEPPENPEARLEEEDGTEGSKVQYITEDGRVTKIVVTCNCGQVTEIDCQYSDDIS